MIDSLFFHIQPVTEVLVFIVPRHVLEDTVEFNAKSRVPVIIVMKKPVNVSVINIDSLNMLRVTLGILQSITDILPLRIIIFSSTLS